MGLAAFFNLEVQMRSGGFAAVADFRDGLSCVHVLADVDVVAVVVAVRRDHIVGVLDADPEAVSAGGADIDDGAGTGGDDGSSHGCGDILACEPAAPTPNCFPRSR
jgi:hypothetical protein